MKTKSKERLARDEALFRISKITAGTPLEHRTGELLQAIMFQTIPIYQQTRILVKFADFMERLP